MRLFYHCFTAFTFLFLLASCKSLKERNEETLETYPSEIREIVIKFLNEGEKRGHKIDLKKLRIEYTDYNLYQNGIYAEAWYRHRNHTIYIDQTTKKWKYNPKSVLFHELGHALLKLDHIEDKHPERPWLPKSIMVHSCIKDIDFGRYEDEYLDELF